MGRACQNCGSTEIDEDHARGDATCMQCGTVIEESMVVSENQFVERAGGSGHLLVGQFVSAERGQTHGLQGVPGLTSQESREVTFQKGRKLIEEIASQLRINQHCVDTAHNFFKMCVTRNLTRGRLRTHVVAACLYMTCRIENTSHLLLDFSDVTQVNVFELGRTLSFISRSLRINLPTTDPCLYIMRFACLLEFGDKQKEVVTLATRLVERMKKDWISSGRRPTGLCGAALLIAARSHNFNRSISDVVRVVHISEAVVRKRLEEFGQTPSAALTIDEFSSIDLEACEDPPAYREAKKRVHEEQRRKEIAEAERVENELHPLEEALEKELEKKRREKFKKLPIAKLVAGDEMLDDDPEFGEAEDSLVRNEILKTVFNVADDRTTTQNPIDRYRQFRPSMETMGLKPSTSAASPMASGISGIGSPQFQLQGYAHTNSIAAEQRDPNDFEDIDDAEIDSYILTEAESVVKEKIWMKVNGEALEAIERRKREREEQEERDRNDPTKKKRRKPAPRKGPATSQTAAQAIEKVIQEKGLSKKVNYDILKEIESASMFDFGSAGTSNSVREDKSIDIIMNDHSLAAEEKELEQAVVNAKPSLENIKGKEPIHSIQLTEQEIHLRKCNAYKKSTSGIEKLRSHFDLAVDPVTQMEEELKQQKEAERVAQIASSTGRKRTRKIKPNIEIGKKKEAIAPASQSEPARTETPAPSTPGSSEQTESAPELSETSYVSEQIGEQVLEPEAQTQEKAPGTPVMCSTRQFKVVIVSPRTPAAAPMRSANATPVPQAQTQEKSSLAPQVSETSATSATSPARPLRALRATPATPRTMKTAPSLAAKPSEPQPAQTPTQEKAPGARPVQVQEPSKPAAPAVKSRYAKVKPVIGKAVRFFKYNYLALDLEFSD